MKEVRWINNMHAWERGRIAQMEIGELRPGTVTLKDGGKGKCSDGTSWDEWDAAEVERNVSCDHVLLQSKKLLWQTKSR